MCQKQQLYQQEQLCQRLNLGVIDGVRTLVCFTVILFHVVFFCCQTFALSGNESLRRIVDSAPALFTTCFHMSVFWALSGFLCALQLDRITTADQMVHFTINRILRLFPLFFLVASLMYLTADLTPNRRNTQKCDTAYYLKTLLFAVPIDDQTARCAGVGWSVVVDVHGYLLLTALFYLTAGQKRTIRKMVLGIMVAASVIRMHLFAANLIAQHGSKQEVLEAVMYGGWDTFSDEFRSVTDGYDSDVGDTFYPNVDFNSDLILRMKDIRAAAIGELYFTGECDYCWRLEEGRRVALF